MSDTENKTLAALGTLIQDKHGENGKARLIRAEQACIHYYYDIVKTHAVITITGHGDITDIDVEPIRNAIHRIN